MEFSLYKRTNIGETSFTRKVQSTLLHYANENRLLGSFNDVVICTEKDRFPANKLVLSCFSTYFEKMFNVQGNQKLKTTIKVNNVDGESLKNILEFIYTGSININSDNVCKLLFVSDYLQVDDAKHFCFDFLSTAISPGNSFLILNIADYYQNDLLKAMAEHMIEDNFDEVSSTNEFKQLSKAKLLQCISQQRGRQGSETSMYNAIVAWAKYDADSRSGDFSGLLQSINLHKLPFSFIHDVVLMEQLVLQSHQLCQLLLEVQKDRLKLVEKNYLKTRVLSLGGVNTPTSVAEVFSCYKEAPKIYPDLPDGRTRGSALVLHDYLFYVSGCSLNDEAEKTVYRINIKEKDFKWEEISSMNRPRQFFGATVFSDYLVVVGGCDEYSHTANGEIYSPFLNTWKNINPMNLRRSGNALVSCNGHLYSIGGYDGDESLSSVERLSTVDGKWEHVNPMQMPRDEVAAVSCNGFIYAIGGHYEDDKNTSLKSAELYDPFTNEWTYISDMNFKRSACSACVLHGYVFVIGGVDEKENIIIEIECYNPFIDKWSIVSVTESELVGHSLVVV